MRISDWSSDVCSSDLRFDLFGFSMLALGLAALQLMLDRGAHLDWFDSIEIWIELGVAISCLWMFIIHMFTARAPLFSRLMLADRKLVTAMGFMVGNGVVMLVALGLVPQRLQHRFGCTVCDTVGKRAG